MAADELTTGVWDLDEDEFPSGAPLEDRARFLLRYAILAPSSHNSQPWRFVVDGDRIEISADETRWLTVADRDRRELHLSLGCAVENLCVAAERFGFDCRIEYPDEDDEDEAAAIVTLQSDEDAASERPTERFAELTERYTSHDLFEDEPLSSSAMETLRGCTPEEDVSLHLIDDADRKRSIAELQAEADRTQMDDPKYRRELGHWIGIGALGDSWLAARIAQTVVTRFDLGDREGRKSSKLIRSAPVLGLLVTTTDERPARIQAGRAYERLALAATAEGVATHPMSQILELPEKRAELASRVGIDDGVPQHLFRLGYIDEPRTHTPRWPLEAFLADEP